MTAIFLFVGVYIAASIVQSIIRKVFPKRHKRKTAAAVKPPAAMVEYKPAATRQEKPLTDRQSETQRQREITAREKELRQQLKIKQAISEKEYYSQVITEQREIIAAYETERRKLTQALKAVETMYKYRRGEYDSSSRASLNDNIKALDDFNRVNALANSVKPEKAARDLEKLTKAIQAANKRIIQAQRKVDAANIIIEIYR